MTRWRASVPPLILVVVAVMQVTLAKKANLSPWKGGGFGMFATTDGTAFRHVRLFVEGSNRSEEIEIAPSLEEAATCAALYPSERLLSDLAEAVVMREHRHGRSVSAVRVDVSRVEFDRRLHATERRVRSLVLTVPTDP